MDRDLDKPVDIRCIHECSKKKVYREYYIDNNTSIVIYYLHHDIKPEIFAPDLDYHTSYEIFREINRYLYDNIPKSIKCTVPQIYMTIDKIKAIEMEDCGTFTLLDKGYDFEIYKKLILWLAELEKLYNTNNISYFIRTKAYDSLVLEKHLVKIIKNYHKDDRYVIKEKADKIYKKFRKIPIGICHFDFRPKNIMINGTGEPRILNVENMCIGPMCYDLTTLLYNDKIIIKDDDRDALIRMYSFLVGIDYNDICLWIKICRKLVRILGV